jgi:hypothetical protein
MNQTLERYAQRISLSLAKQGKPKLGIKIEAYQKMEVKVLAEKGISQLKHFVRDGKEQRVDEAIAILEVIKHKLGAGK